MAASPLVEPVTGCWVLTEGMIGTQNQCVALAQACGFEQPVLKHIKLRAPWRWVTPYVRHFSPAALAPGSSDLTGPWPQLLIASGRKSIAASLWIKRQSGGRTKLVIVQSPVVKDKNLDLVIAPRHDAYDAPNAISITGALSHVTTAKLDAARGAFPDLAALPAPRVAVLIGGTSRTHQITAAVAQRLAGQLQALQQQGCSLMITASRRTPPAIAEMLRRELSLPNITFWDGTGANPYLAYLAYADIILVSEDSVSMASEAISTGKPVYIIKLSGESARFKRFHDDIVANGYALWFDGRIDAWPTTPPHDLADAAARVKMLL